MNKIITNLAQIAQAAEYFDKQTSAAWRIRSTLTNMAVWAANAHIYALRTMDAERIAKSSIKLATLRVWMRDSTDSGLTLDFTPGNVRKTLGLERVTDIHVEACREARSKCIRTRSATQFKQFYDAAVSAFEERRRQREEAVEEISNLLSDQSMVIDHEVADYMNAFLNWDVAPGEINDTDLYDDNAVEQQRDQLAEAIGNALEAMWDVCDIQLAAAITDEKIQRLAAYQQGIHHMMGIAGVNRTRLAERRAKLEAQIDAQISDAGVSVKAIDADIEAQIAAMGEPQAETEKPKRTRTIKKQVA